VPLLLLIIAGIILLANPTWFHGADVVGIVLLVAGGLGLLWFLIVLRFIKGVFREVKGSGTPRFPGRF
jgi:hypothetical protein